MDWIHVITRRCSTQANRISRATKCSQLMQENNETGNSLNFRNMKEITKDVKEFYL